MNAVQTLAAAAQLVLTSGAAALSAAAARHAKGAHTQATAAQGYSSAVVDALLELLELLHRQEQASRPDPGDAPAAAARDTSQTAGPGAGPGPALAPAPSVSAERRAAPLVVPASTTPARDYVPCACGDDTRPGFHSVQTCQPPGATCPCARCQETAGR